MDERHRLRPPGSEAELLARAYGLVGRTLGEIGSELAVTFGADTVHTKGKLGELVERALGASGGTGAVHDFPGLGVELKTIPVDAELHPRESTFVCTIALRDAESVEWESSWVRAKLARVLWVPIETPRTSPWQERTVLEPLLWSPSPEQEAGLRADFEELMGTIAIGRIEALTARDGRWLQVRPKAATGSVRTTVIGLEGEVIRTIPRGFYLRASFTRALLARVA
jgi:DNA mismatch repair protein MutH